MKYIVSTIPLTFAKPKPVVKLAVINTDNVQKILDKTKAIMLKN